MPKQIFFLGWIYLWVLLPNNLSAQPLTFSFSYAGNNLWNPGMQIRSNVPIPKQNPAQKGYWTVSSAIGSYFDPQSHAGLYLQSGMHYHWSKVQNHYVGMGLSPLGTFYSLLPETFEVDELGEVTQVGFPRRVYFAPSIHLEKGWSPAALKGFLHAGGQLMFLMPYNTSVLPLVFIELGYSIPLNSQNR